MMKIEKAMRELLRSVANENRSDELKSQLKKVRSAFLNHREVSAQEAVYCILSLSMTHLGKRIVFVDANPTHERVGVLKSFKEISELDDEDHDVFRKNLLERYKHLPHNLNSMCLADFAAVVIKHQLMQMMAVMMLSHPLQQYILDHSLKISLY